MKTLKTPLFIGLLLLFALSSCGLSGGGGNFGNPTETAILEQIYDGIQASNNNQIKSNRQIFEGIQFGIAEGNEAGDASKDYLAHEMREMNKKTGEVKHYLKDLSQKLIELAGDPVVGLENPGESVKNQEFWGVSSENGGRGSGEAKRLRSKVNDYVAYVNDLQRMLDESGKATEPFDQIAEDPMSDHGIPADHPDKGKTWEAFNFDGSSVIANLVSLEALEAKVLRIEAEMLSFFGSKVGVAAGAGSEGGKLQLVSLPMSNVVAAGMKFETKILVASALSGDRRPEFSASGNVQTTDNGNAAIMTMSASGGFAKGSNEKEVSYSVRARVPNPDGTLEELSLNETFIVRKPAVIANSASVQVLYKDCGNTMVFDVPSMGDLYNPKFRASSAQVLPSKAQKGKVTIVPTGKKCVVSVSSMTNGQMIKVDDLSYKVIEPPKPTLQMIVNGKAYNGMSSISSKSGVVVKAKPDSDFMSGLPKDARYSFDKIEVLVKKGTGAPKKVGSVSGLGKSAQRGIELKLGQYLKGVVSGSQCFLKIGNVYRLNFKNKKVEVKFDDREKVFAFSVK